MLDRTDADTLQNVNTEKNPVKHWFWIEEEICPPQDRVSIRMIQQAVADHFGLKIHDLISEVRTPKEVIARHTGMYLSRRLTKRSHPFIGKQFNRDHSVSVYAEKKIEALLITNSAIAARIESIKSKLLGETA